MSNKFEKKIKIAGDENGELVTSEMSRYIGTTVQ